MTSRLENPKFLIKTDEGQWIPINDKMDEAPQNGDLFVPVACLINDKPVYAGPKSGDNRFVVWNGAFAQSV